MENLKKISDDYEKGLIDSEKAKLLLIELIAQNGTANQFEIDTFKLINSYMKSGLSKPDLVRKMEYITGSCKMS